MAETRTKGTGRTAVVTGASSGIGETYARRLAGLGCDLVLVARRKGKLEKLSKELESKYGIRAEVLEADLAGEDGLRKAEERIERVENLEILVNNAGFGTRGLFFEASPEGQDRMHRLHVLAVVALSHAALKKMVARGKGSLVNVSSVAGFGQSPGNAGYCATKAWMNRFTEGLRLDIAAAGSPVRVQALCPGYTLTEFHEAMGVGRGHVPARWWLSPEEVVDASVRGLEKGSLYVVPGLRYKFYVFLLRILPGVLLRSLSLRFVPWLKSRISSVPPKVA